MVELSEKCPQLSKASVDVQSFLYSLVSPSQFLVEVYPQVADRIGGRNNYGAWGSPKSEVNRGAFLGVGLDPPSAKPVLDGVEMLLEVKRCYGGVFVGRQQGSVI